MNGISVVETPRDQRKPPIATAGVFPNESGRQWCNRFAFGTLLFGSFAAVAIDGINPTSLSALTLELSWQSEPRF